MDRRNHRVPTPRPEPERSLTWPQTLVLSATNDHIRSKDRTLNDGEYGDPTYGFFEADLENNPEYHFLSPIQMYEYEDWADDSDEEGEEVEWDAGITDFALFDDDRRRAQESNQALPSKWNGMLVQQASALQRAVRRNRADSDPYPLRKASPGSDDGVPSLTPDVSPDLRDDLDVESYHGQTVARPSVPNYLTIVVTPPTDNEVEEDDDDALPFFVSGEQDHSPTRKLQRPGLKHSRTMSGHIHTWTRPSMDTVGEDSEGEEQAERENGWSDETEIRGRR
jgi:hypothetical protein